MPGSAQYAVRAPPRSTHFPKRLVYPVIADPEAEARRGGAARVVNGGVR